MKLLFFLMNRYRRNPQNRLRPHPCRETISLTTEDGLNYIFIPLGIFSVDDREYLLVRDFAQEDENIHLLLHTTDENGDDSFETVSGEKFNQVMQDFENFISHISSEEQSMPD